MENFDWKYNPEVISVFLTDRTTFFRQGVRSALEKFTDIEVTGEFDVDEGAFELIQATGPRVVLIDIAPPHYSGVHLARKIAQNLQGISTALLTPYLDDAELVLATTSGASAYISRYIDDHELAMTVRYIAAGKLPLINSLIAKPDVLERVLRNFQDLSARGISVDSSNAPITGRETEILSYVAQGYGNKQIAQVLKISEQTIKNHMTSILRKLDASDRTQAVVMAMQSGWISTSSGAENPTGAFN